MIVVPSFIKFNFKEMVKFQAQEIITPYSQLCKFCVSCQSILRVSKCLPLSKLGDSTKQPMLSLSVQTF